MSKFNDLINSDVPVLVDFYATWCGPCKQLGPIIEEVSIALKGKAKVLKIDIDKNPQAASAYGIRGVPTMILFKNGKQVWRQSGVLPKESIVQAVQKNS